MRRVRQRPAERRILTENGAQFPRHRRRHTLKGGKTFIAMCKKPQHRQHALDRRIKAARQDLVRRDKSGAKRQEIDEERKQPRRIARGMAAIGQHLSYEWQMFVFASIAALGGLVGVVWNVLDFRHTPPRVN